MSHHLDLTILGLLAAVIALSILARKVHVPYPIALVLGGLGLGFIPGIGEVTLDPDLVLLIFLPPLLYGAAFFSNPRELKDSIRPISGLAVWLVFASTAAVAVVAHELVGMPWGVAFVLGAVVSPTDAVAPAQIVRRFGVPRRVVTVIEGENLTNDWTALTIYRFAIAAVVSGSFSWAWAAPRFVLTGLGGVAVGLAAGLVIRWIRRRLEDPPTEITISLFSGFAAYIPAEELGLSGVIAAVTVGLYLGWHSAELTTAETRMQGTGTWSVLVFLLNAVLFILVGLQFPSLLEDIEGQSTGDLLLYATAVSATVIVVRLVWCFAVAHGLPRLLPHAFEDDPEPPWRVTLLLGWSSMRGAVALAAALAIPTTIDGGGAFPERDLVIFLTYSVILATLVLQGLTLGPLVQMLRLRSDGLDEQEEVLARIKMAEAGIARIDALAEEGWVTDETADRTRAMRDFRRRRFAARMDGDASIDERSARYQRFMHEVIAAERDALVMMRNAGDITDDVRRLVERDLDLEEARLN
jgi:monovalent cation/hydrogen antiporter